MNAQHMNWLLASNELQNGTFFPMTFAKHFQKFYPQLMEEFKEDIKNAEKAGFHQGAMNSQKNYHAHKVFYDAALKVEDIMKTHGATRAIGKTGISQLTENLHLPPGAITPYLQRRRKRSRKSRKSKKSRKSIV